MRPVPSGVAQDSLLKSCGFSRFLTGLKCRKSESGTCATSLRGRGSPRASQNNMSHPSHWPPLYMIGSILCIALQAAQTWGKEGLRQPRAGDNAVAVALAKVLRMRQTIRNSQNEPGMCPGINDLTFWGLASRSQTGGAGSAGSARFAPQNLAAFPDP